jgi:cell division protein FtsB
MVSPLLNIVMQYGGIFLGAIIFGVTCKAYLASKVQVKIKRYQCEIVKSHAKILELEAENQQLENRIRDVEGTFIKNKLVLN